MLPLHLITIRHGESEGNQAMNAAKKGDTSRFTEKYVNTPGRNWRLSPDGELQPQAVGEWLRAESAAGAFGGPDVPRRHYVSPLRRTRHTAARLGLVDFAGNPVPWRLNRALRERDWGDIETMTKAAYRDAFPASELKERIDPLYWRPPGGESIADVAENRVLDFYDTLHREASDHTVFAVTHGEWKRANLLAITRANDEDYWIWDEGFPTEEEAQHPAAPDFGYTSLLANLFGGKLRIPNCATMHFSRVNPHTREESTRVNWLRMAAPKRQADGSWRVELVQDWTYFEPRTFSASDLLSF